MKPLSQPGMFGKLRFVLIVVFISISAFVLGRAAPFRSAEDVVFDVFASTLSPEIMPRDDIVVVASTEDTLAALPFRSPIDRSFLARLLQEIEQLGPSKIGLDILLDTPSDPLADEQLRRVIAGINVELISVSASVSGPRSTFESSMLGSTTRASPYLLADGHDNVVRRLDKAASLPPLAIALAGTSSAGPDQERFRLFRGREGGAPFRVVPAHLVGALPENTDWLRRRIVLVGAILDDQDRHVSPLRFASEASGLPGLVVHAYQLAHLLDGAPRTEAPFILVLVLIAAFALSGAGIGGRGKPTVLAFFAFVSVAAAQIVLGAATYALWGWPLPITGPLIALALSAGGFAYYRRNAAQKRLAFVTEAFGKYMDERLVAELTRHPHRSFIEPQEGEATFLFTDMNGFTAFVDQSSPAQIKYALDQYIDIIASSISAHGGIVDRFVGDGVHAFFGMPIRQDGASAAAIACSFDILDKTSRLRAELEACGIAIGSTRIGLHSGTAVFGDFGGQRRADFTAHGPAVNIAARLVDLAREHKAAICASSSIFETQIKSAGWVRSDTSRIEGVRMPLEIWLWNDDASEG